MNGLRAGLRRTWPYLLVAAVLLAAGAYVATAGVDGPPLDPASTAPDGTKALVDVLAELGVAVEVSADPPGPEASTTLLLVDNLDDATRAALRDWVADGGRLVVADPTSALTPDPVGPTAFGPIEASLQRDCEVAALADVERVSAPSSVVLEAPPAATGCFPRGEGHWLVVEPEQDGVVVGLGGPWVFSNQVLGDADNALLAAALLAADPAAGLHLQQPPLPGDGDVGLADLIPQRVWLFAVQLLVAFALVVAWRMRRLGRPVIEPQPVDLAGSELTVAVGNLLQQTRARRQAADLLRQDLRRTLLQRLRLPPDVGDEDLAAAAAARGGVAADDVLAVLARRAPDDEEALVAYAGQVEAVRQQALGAAVAGAEPDGERPASPSPTTS